MSPLRVSINKIRNGRRDIKLWDTTPSGGTLPTKYPTCGAKVKMMMAAPGNA
jgi:hypothetical protein